MSRRHNDVNIVTLSGARLGPSRPTRSSRAFLRTEFEGGRHARRGRADRRGGARVGTPWLPSAVLGRRDWRVGGTDHREATHLISRSAWAQSASRRGAPMSDLSPDFFNRPLAEVDPEIADAIQHELDRQQRTLEMIASENFVPQAILECQGSVLTNKYAEGYPGQALLRRLRVRRHHRAAGDRPRQGALRRRARQRPAARRRPGQRRRLPRAAAAGRHDHGPRAAPRRPPHPRHEAQRVRAPVRHRALRGRRARRASSTWTRSSASPTSAGRS